MEKIYEIGYLLTPFTPEEGVSAAVEKAIKHSLVAAGGVIKTEQMPASITLAYPLKQTVEHKSTVFNTAYFGAIIFTIAQDKIEDLVKIWKKQPELIRSLVIMLPSVAIEPHRPPVRRVVTPMEGDAPVAAAPVAKKDKEVMTPEAMDKEIDSLLTAAN